MLFLSLDEAQRLNSMGSNLNSLALARRAEHMEVFCKSRIISRIDIYYSPQSRRGRKENSCIVAFPGLIPVGCAQRTLPSNPSNHSRYLRILRQIFLINPGYYTSTQI